MTTAAGATLRPRGTTIRPFALVIALTFVALSFPTATVAADAPNTCTGATVARAQNTWLSETISSSSDVDWYRFDKSSSGYALITLGRLVTDFDLYLYRPCSTLVASSHRSRTQHDQIYRYLSAGTYYVKVVGYAGASSATAYALRFRPLSESVQVLSMRAPWTDSAGYLHLQGEVLNNTADRRRWIQVNATLFNSANAAVGSSVGYTDVALMLPRSRSPFEIVVRKPSTFHHASVVVARSTATTSAPVGNLSLSGGGLTLVSGLPHFQGRLTNRNTGGVRLAQVMTTLYDTYGNVAGLGWAYTDPASIGPGASATFDVATSGSASPNRYVHQAQARGIGCYAAPRYAPTRTENFAPTTSAPATINRASASQRVALTFDMGGRMDPAVAILNRLVQYKVCATIFPTGAISDTPDGRAALAIVRAHPELFELGTHTMHHCDLVRGGGGAPGSAEAAICASMPTSGSAHEAFVKKQLTDAESSIVAATGRGTRSFWRAPYGSLNSTIIQWAAEVGWRTHFKWDVDTIDWKPVSQGGPSATAMALKVVNNARSGTVVLMHLGGFETLDALPAMIDGLRSRGFTLTTLSDMAQ